MNIELERTLNSVPSNNSNVEQADVWTVKRILDWTTTFLEEQGSDTARLDSEILLAHARKCPRIHLYTRYEEPLTDNERAVMRDLVQRRAKAEPVAYLVGHREFFSLDFRVTPDVLIPRPDTETLVVESIELAKECSQPRIADVGTGSGCVAIALAVNLPAANLTAVDVSRQALAVASENAKKHAVEDRIQFVQGNLLSDVAGGTQFDLIVSNPPYIRPDEIPTLQADVQLHEPHLALDGGGVDGLNLVRQLIQQATSHLVANGHLIIEISPEQAEATKQAMEQSQFCRVEIVDDLSGKSRVVRGQLINGN